MKKLILLFLLFLNLSYGQTNTRKETYTLYFIDTIYCVNSDEIISIFQFKVLEPQEDFYLFYTKLIDYDSIIALKNINLWLLDTINKIRINKCFKPIIFDDWEMNQVLDDGIYKLSVYKQKPMFAKNSIELSRYQKEVLNNIFSHNNLKKRLLSKNLNSFSIGVMLSNDNKIYYHVITNKFLIFNTLYFEK